MLNIKDNNVYFYYDFLKIVNINGKKTKVFRARDFDSFKATKSYKPLKNGCFFVKF